MIAGKTLPRRRSLQSVLHQELLDPSVFTLIFNRLNKIRTLCRSLQHVPFVFISLRTLCAKTRQSGTSQRSKRALSYSASSIYHHFQALGLSPMFSVQYELFAYFCNADPLFSSLYELFAQKHRGGGMLLKNPRARFTRVYRCPEAAGNTVCWDGGIGTSPLRSRQRMEFNTSLLASSAWRQFIAADAFPPGAVAALLLKMSPLRRLLSSASNGCCPAVPVNSEDMIGAYASL